MRRLAAAVILLTGCLSERREAQQRRQLELLLERARTELRSDAFSDARTAIERGLKIAVALGDSVAQWDLRLMRCEVLLADRAATDNPLVDLQAPLPQRPEFARLSARQKMLEGWEMVNEGHSKDAGPILDAAYQLAEASQDTETLMDVETLQGARFMHEQRFDVADNWLHRALDHARANNLPNREARILLNLGSQRLSRKRYDEALGYLQMASDRARTSASDVYFSAQTSLAICYYRLGDVDRAIQILLPLVERQQRSGPSPSYQMVLGVAGNAYLLNDDTRHATQYLEEAFNVAMQIGRKAQAAVWAGNLSILYGRLDDWDKAERFNNEAIRIKNEGDSKALVYNTLNAADIAVGRGRLGDGEGLYREVVAMSADNAGVQWDAYGGLGHCAMLQQHPDQACRHFESAVNIIEQTRADLSSTESKLPFLTRLIRFYQQYVDALMAQGDYERALAVADSSRAQVLAERFGSSRSRRLSPAALKTIARESGSTIVSYWLEHPHSHAWVVTADRIHHLELQPDSEIALLVAEYSAAIQDRLADPLRTRIPAGERLYGILVEPLREWLPVGSKVVLVPDGVLAGLNFETLPVPGEPAHYWIEDVILSVAPSIGVLSRSTLKPDGARSLLLIGDPENADPTLPVLRNAPSEIRDIMGHFNAADQVVKTRSEAVPQAYQAAGPERFSVIHFTAHAIANRESPLDSSVLLSGGKLYARDVMDRRLNAQLVTISACRGAGSRTFGGEGLVGFAWAFLRAGARNVIAGLWDVNDQSTANLMDITYRELESGRTPQEALRTAKLSLIRSSGNLKKPYYWGPFQVYTVAP